MKWALLLLIAVPFVLNSTMLGFLTSPWAPWWFSRAARAGGGEVRDQAPPVPTVQVDPLDLALGHGFVSDAQRYILARAAGFSAGEAIIATAISIAENGRGDPALPSAPNRDRSIDLGLWQINSQHWAAYGGSQALIDPFNNARAAYSLYRSGGWTLWCTYPGGCGGGPGSPNWPQALVRARAAATSLPAGQA